MSKKKQLNAVDSLFGRSVLGGNVGKKARPQEVHTPAWLWEAAAQALGGIHLDPCAASDCRDWRADVNFVLPEDTAEHPIYVDPTRGVVVDALTIPWAGAHTFFWNPPYGRLRPWMDKVLQERIERPTVRSIGIFPARLHRRWLVDFLIDFECDVVRLAPVKFEGFEQAFPEPLMLAVRGVELPTLELETCRYPSSALRRPARAA